MASGRITPSTLLSKASVTDTVLENCRTPLRLARASALPVARSTLKSRSATEHGSIFHRRNQVSGSTFLFSNVSERRRVR